MQMLGGCQEDDVNACTTNLKKIDLNFISFLVHTNFAELNTNDFLFLIVGNISLIKNDFLIDNNVN